LVYFSRFGILYEEKSGNPDCLLISFGAKFKSASHLAILRSARGHACTSSSQNVSANVEGKVFLRVGKQPKELGWPAHREQGCQMAYFPTKKSNLGKFGRVSQSKIIVYFMAIWSILRPFGIFYGHSVYFMVIWYIFPVWVCCTMKNLATLIGSRC
jgi:hypothetical protein